MTCKNCPNQTDDKCCHESIRPHELVGDTKAVRRAIAHQDVMRKEAEAKNAG